MNSDINDMPQELANDIKDKNKLDSLQYDEDLRSIKNDIIEHYMMRVSQQEVGESLLEIMCEVMEAFEIDETDLASILKNDETMLNVIKMDCMGRNLLKEKDRHINVGEIFE